MALLFELKLTHTQMILLRVFADWIDSGRKEELSPFGDMRFQSFVTSVKYLLREKLISKTEPPEGKTYTPSKLGRFWDITKKGRATLAVIDCELQEAKETLRRIPSNAITATQKDHKRGAVSGERE